MKLIDMLLEVVVFVAVTGLSLLVVADILLCDSRTKAIKHRHHGPAADHAS